MKDPKLQKRVTWIANCGSLSSFSIITFDDWKTNLFKIFLEAHTVRIWYEYQGVWSYKIVALEPQSCYYLGKFPWYWDYQYGMPVAPTGSLWTYIDIVAPPMPTTLYFKPAAPAQPIQPFSMNPSVHTQEYMPLDILTRDDIEFFHGSAALQNMDRQIAFLNARSIKRVKCLAQNYLYKTPLKPKILNLLA